MVEFTHAGKPIRTTYLFGNGENERKERCGGGPPNSYMDGCPTNLDVSTSIYPGEVGPTPCFAHHDTVRFGGGGGNPRNT